MARSHSRIAAQRREHSPAPLAQSIRTVEAKSVSQAFQQSLKILQTWSGPSEPDISCWFRGVSDSRHSLLPGAYRDDVQGYDEYEPLVCFVQEGPAYGDVGGLSEWSTYYLAQHHGLRTRLLDWTESFSAALFFAVCSYERDNPRPGSLPCVWMLDPGLVNQASVGDDTIISPENNPAVDLWLPTAIRDSNALTQADREFLYNNRHPLAIYPRKTNQRIIAQQGVFTVHGRDRIPLEEFVLARNQKPNDRMARILLADVKPAQWLHELGLLGVRKQHVYPDIDTFAKCLKATYEQSFRK
jgi:hypothetical protein